MRSSSHFLFFGAKVSEDTLRLDADESRHLHAVLRAQPGDEVQATDGAGVIFDCRVKSISNDGAELTVSSRRNFPDPVPAISCYVGIPDREAFEEILGSLAPLGIRSLTPVICEACQEKWWKSGWERLESRLGRKIIAGVKQSLNPWLPGLTPPTRFEEALVKSGGRILCADIDGRSLSEIAVDMRGSPDSASCWIGPPGGFSPEEIDALRNRGALPVRLGPYRLRTETALIVMCGAMTAHVGPHP